MTHILVLQGTSGATLPSLLQPASVKNAQSFGAARIEHRRASELRPLRVTNVQVFGAAAVRATLVRQLTQSRVVNANAFPGASFAALPFYPENDEATALFAALTGSYTTTAKRQMDRLVTELKSAGVWSKLDWYGNAFWAATEHDALLNWINPAQTLTKVGGASCILGQGLKGVNPMTDPGRYKSGWNVGDGPHSSATSFAMFCKITSVDSPQDGMQPMALFQLSTPGPSAPDGSFLILSIGSNTGSAGANVLPFNGNSGFPVGDGIGLWGTSRSGNTNLTVKDSVTLASDTVSGTSSYRDPDGICVAGSGPGFGAQRSFPGTELYWGWGTALTAAEFGSIETAFANAQVPVVPDNIIGALLIDSASNYLVDEDGNYVLVDAS